jgi:hypothetical protein
MGGFEGMAGGRDPANGSLPERVENPRTWAASRIHRSDITPDHALHARLKFSGKNRKISDFHKLSPFKGHRRA